MTLKKSKTTKLIANYYSDKGYEITSETFEENDAIVLRITYVYEGGTEYNDDSNHEVGDTTYYQYIYSGNEYIWLWCGCDEEHAEELEDVLDSMVLENPSAPA